MTLIIIVLWWCWLTWYYWFSCWRHYPSLAGAVAARLLLLWILPLVGAGVYMDHHLRLGMITLDIFSYSNSIAGLKWFDAVMLLLAFGDVLWQLLISGSCVSCCHALSANYVGYCGDILLWFAGVWFMCVSLYIGSSWMQWCILLLCCFSGCSALLRVVRETGFVGYLLDASCWCLG